MEIVSSKKWVNILLVVVILTALGGIFYLIYGSNTTINVNEDEFITRDLPSAEVIDENYSIYRNHEFGYSFEYPSTWDLYDEDKGTVLVEAGGDGSKNILIDTPYPDGVLDDMDFITWADTQEWPFAPLSPAEYFEEVVLPSGLLTYKRASATSVHTVIVIVNSDLLYVSREDGEGEGNIDGEDIYFHLLNSFETL